MCSHFQRHFVCHFPYRTKRQCYTEQHNLRMEEKRTLFLFDPTRELIDEFSVRIQLYVLLTTNRVICPPLILWVNVEPITTNGVSLWVWICSLTARYGRTYSQMYYTNKKLIADHKNQLSEKLNSQPNQKGIYLQWIYNLANKHYYSQSSFRHLLHLQR